MLLWFSQTFSFNYQLQEKNNSNMFVPSRETRCVCAWQLVALGPVHVYTVFIVYMHAHNHKFASTDKWLHVCTWACVHVCACLCVSMCKGKSDCVSSSICLPMCAQRFACVHVCTCLLLWLGPTWALFLNVSGRSRGVEDFGGCGCVCTERFIGFSQDHSLSLVPS